jgi:histone deacetylase 11
MLLGSEGTILASIAALKLGWAINLAGGYHHASCTKGGGFCIYPDITLAIHYLQTRLNVQKVMIIDLDAHQGNGH